MGAKQALLEQAEHEYEGLRTAVAGLDEAQMRQVWLGSWGVREILAHITGWHREVIPGLERLGRGGEGPPEYDDFDGWNARFVAAFGGWASADILRELEASHREMVSTVSRLPDEYLVEGKAVSGLVDGVAGAHYREHAEQIREWRRQ